jgi:hypothetical protein
MRKYVVRSYISTYTYTCPSNGRYFLAISVPFEITTSGSITEATFQWKWAISSGDVVVATFSGESYDIGSYNIFSHMTVEDLSASDTIKFQVYMQSNSGGQFSTATSANYLNEARMVIAKIGD